MPAPESPEHTPTPALTNALQQSGDRLLVNATDQLLRTRETYSRAGAYYTRAGDVSEALYCSAMVDALTTLIEGRRQ